MPDEMRTVSCQGREVRYRLVRSNVKNVNVRVTPTGEVRASAAPQIAAEFVDGLVIKNAERILRGVKSAEQAIHSELPPKQFVNGETFLILGRQVRLFIQPADTDGIDFDGNFIRLSTRHPNDAATVKRLVIAWLDARCLDTFREVIDAIYPTFAKYGVPRPHVTIKTMKTRWGSCCAERARMSLNRRLFEHPRICIEYVVMHEFCHFFHRNHTNEYYATLTAFMPDWADRKRLLESQM